jgi:hypothetical protein
MIDQLVIALLLLVNLRMFATSRVDSLIRGSRFRRSFSSLAVVSREGAVSWEGGCSCPSRARQVRRLARDDDSRAPVAESAARWNLSSGIACRCSSD